MRKPKSAKPDTPRKNPARQIGAPRAEGAVATICVNGTCKLRKGAGGCAGFEGCPGYKARG